MCNILKWFLNLVYPTIPNKSVSQTDKISSANSSPCISGLNWSIKRVLDNEMLSDTEIFAALSILRIQFHEKNCKGFQDPQIFNARFMKSPLKIVSRPTDKFIQILHDGNAHWITLTNIGTEDYKHVRIFDSLFNEKTYEENMMLRNFLKRLYEKNKNATFSDIILLEDSIRCTIEPVQVQSDTALCGLFAIAFAFDLCRGLCDPRYQFYNEEKMRKHLFKCLRENEFIEFPKIAESGEYKCVRSRPREIEIFI